MLCRSNAAVCHSKHIVKSGKYNGFCYACCARLGSGNKTRGIRKKRAALKGIGRRLKNNHSAASLANRGFDKHHERLLDLVSNESCVDEMDKYVTEVVQQTLRIRAPHVQKVTLVEAPCDVDSSIAQANADLMGASLRIVEPTAEYPSQKRPPALVCGTVVNWPLDVLAKKGRNQLAAYLNKLEPVPGTEMVHFHASPVCTGSTKVNRFLNKNCHFRKRRYHAKCRRGVADMRRVITSYRRSSGFARNGQTRSVSAEQPFGASLRSKYKTAKHPILVGRCGNMCTQVNGCMCGLKVKGISCCKRWVFQTDNPSLAGMLSQLQCGKKHHSIKPLGKAPLKNTGKYPAPLGKLFVLSLMLRWSKDRHWVV